MKRGREGNREIEHLGPFPYIWSSALGSTHRGLPLTRISTRTKVTISYYLHIYAKHPLLLPLFCRSTHMVTSPSPTTPTAAYHLFHSNACHVTRSPDIIHITLPAPNLPNSWNSALPTTPVRVVESLIYILMLCRGKGEEPLVREGRRGVRHGRKMIE